MAKRLEQEETAPVNQASNSMEDVLNENGKTISMIVGAVLFAIVGYYAYKNLVLAPKMETASFALATAQSQFEKDSFQLALVNPGGGDEGFLDIIDNYGGTPAANTANYYAGICYLNIGKYDAALAHLNDFSTDDAELSVMKLGLIGDCYSEKNELDKALSQYRKAADAGTNEELASYYLLKVGMLNEKLEKNAEALAAYKEIKREYPNASFAADIQKYITRAQNM